MNLHRLSVVFLVAGCSGGIAAAQASSEAQSQSQTPAAATASATGTGASSETSSSPRADAYYNYALGHLFEVQYESTNDPEFATKAIDAYKKAYELDPKSPVIGERLAEMYWESDRVHEAIAEASDLLKQNPNDLATRRLLARIYLRSLGDLTSTAQSDMAERAIEQYKEVYRLDPTDSESALWLARLYRLRNEHDKAEAVLNSVLKTDPENEAAVEQLTQLLLDEGKNDQAVSLLEGMVSRSPSPTLLDLLGDAYTQTHDLSKAEAAYRKASETDPSESSHLRGLGQTLLAEEKYSDALAVYQKLSDLMPDDADVYLRLGQIYRELNKLDLAEQSLLKARQFEPGSPEVMYNEAMLYEAQGRYSDAITVLSDAVNGLKSGTNVLPSRRRSLAILYQQLGQLYRDAQNYSAAVNTYNELGALGAEEDRRARLLIMDTYRSAKDLPKALAAGKDATAKYPSDPAIVSSNAMLLGENGQVDEAVKILRGQLTKTPADRDTYLNISQVYERSRRFKEAEEAAHQAEALSSVPRDNETVWFMLGAIYERQKFYDRAEEEFKKALAVNPRDAAVLNYYGYMLGDLGIRLDEAQSLVQRALKEEPNSGAYLDSLGWIYYRENKLADAEATLRKAVQFEGHDATIRSHLGDVYAKAGRMDLAAVQWEKSLAEWRHTLPADFEPDKMAEVEKKLSQVKHRVAQKSSPQEAKPQ
ncbi:MAG TPA: tetratricopeptide repeat protein [Candidatus Acidoferrum sp.]|nr:tetratricopeptide repeat protein [Candidatus Acidoferrum sp.]